MTSDDYLAIFSVILPVVTMAVVVGIAAMKQEWMKKKGG